MKNIRILLADHEPLALAGTAELLKEHHPQFKVSKNLATTTEEFRQIAMEFIPEIVLTNDHTWGIRANEERKLDAIEVIEHARGQYPVVGYLTYPEQSRVAMMHAAGAKGIFSKNLDTDNLAVALEEIAMTGTHPSVKDEVDMHVVTDEKQSELQKALSLIHGKALTKREMQVLLLVTKGLPNKLIGKELGISIETVKEHVQNILRKLNMNDRTMIAVATARILRDLESKR